VRIASYIACALLALACPLQASAYVGPGLGAGMVAAVLGVVAGLLMLVVGVVWYPIKRLVKRFRAKK
jgi:hypothetical protein